MQYMGGGDGGEEAMSRGRVQAVCEGYTWGVYAAGKRPCVGET